MTISYRGQLFRALNPVFARDPLSGRGAELYGGRFNPKGTPAIYTSISALTALREANQVGNLQPTMLVSYEAEIDRIFDTRDEAALAGTGMDAVALADPAWRDQMKAKGQSASQAFARRLIGDGYHGLMVRSFAPGTTEDDLNLVLWRWSDAAPHRLVLIDDENRLSPTVDVGDIGRPKSMPLPVGPQQFMTFSRAAHARSLWPAGRPRSYAQPAGIRSAGGR